MLREMDPRRSQNQGCPTSTHLHSKNTCENYWCVDVQTPNANRLSRSPCLFIERAGHALLSALKPSRQEVVFYALYIVHIPHSLSYQITHFPIISSPVTVFRPLHTIITTLHSVTRRHILSGVFSLFSWFSRVAFKKRFFYSSSYMIREHLENEVFVH